jgi:hypothetical protein
MKKCLLLFALCAPAFSLGCGSALDSRPSSEAEVEAGKKKMAEDMARMTGQLPQNESARPKDPNATQPAP